MPISSGGICAFPGFVHFQVEIIQGGKSWAVSRASSKTGDSIEKIDKIEKFNVYNPICKWVLNFKWASF